MTNVAKCSIAFLRHYGVCHIKEAGQLFSAKFDASILVLNCAKTCLPRVFESFIQKYTGKYHSSTPFVIALECKTAINIAPYRIIRFV